jgi:hypothetical protein
MADRVSTLLLISIAAVSPLPGAAPSPAAPAPCAAAQQSTSDCAGCTATALCAVHQKAEAAAIAELAAALKSKDPFARKGAITKLSELDHARPTGPSQDVAKLVGGMLDDGALHVRVEAVNALAARMHPDVAVPALTGALEATMKELSKLPFGRGDWGGGGGRGGGPGGGAGADGGEPPPEDPKAIERRKKREDLNALAALLVTAVRALPDDRSVTALSETLPQLTRWHGALLESTAQGLITLRARKGIEAVVQRIKSSPVGDNGSRWGGPDKTGATLRDLLALGLADAGCDPVPEWSDEEHPDWERWFAKNQKHFPAKLGKYGIEQMNAATAASPPAGS